MAPKRNRNRGRNRGESASSTAEVAPGPSQGATPKRQRARSRRRSRSQQGNNTMMWLVVGGIAVVVVLIGAVVLSVANGGGSVNNFDIAVYQGEEELGGTNINFMDLVAREQPIVLNFWAGDCPPCRAEILDGSGIQSSVNLSSSIPPTSYPLVSSQ